MVSVRKNSGQPKAVIAGGGPAGLTAAYELLKAGGRVYGPAAEAGAKTGPATGIHPVVLEECRDLGGISKTINYKGNRMDIGGHRFFSKNDDVMRWWEHIMPLAPGDTVGEGKTGSRKKSGDGDRVMLVRKRSSRIYFLRHFFDYPISMKWQTFAGMGLWNSVRAGFGYIAARIAPKKEDSLENFYINRFGRPLYEMFFEDYTEKVWGVHPSKIGADWGAQRVKGLSITALLKDIITRPFRKKNIDQKNVETSLIEQFIYPKYGPGQLWEAVGSDIEAAGGEIRRGCRVTGVLVASGEGVCTAQALAPEKGGDPRSGEGLRVQTPSPEAHYRVTGVEIEHEDGSRTSEDCDWFLSSMPLKDLVACIKGIEVPSDIRRIAEGLPYRDFITVGLLVSGLKIPARDTWIYIQERDVKVGRLQIFNNWSPYMVADPEHSVFIGLEYFCNEGDELWEMEDNAFIAMATDELVRIGIIDNNAVLDATRVKVRKAYPAYFGTYKEIGKLREWLDSIDNLYCIGRNGQHRYNNMDHSMLTAMAAVRCITTGTTDKASVWDVNTEQEYHESK